MKVWKNREGEFSLLFRFYFYFCVGKFTDETTFNNLKMEELDNKDRDREELFSRSVRAGKRTYFFDVKSTAGNEQYLTITESKRRFNNEQGKFVYEKHKLFLYKEDFDKFFRGLNESIEFIRTGKIPETSIEEEDKDIMDHYSNERSTKELSFEDLSPES
jgi:hypothetical protein